MDKSKLLELFEKYKPLLKKREVLAAMAVALGLLLLGMGRDRPAEVKDVNIPVTEVSQSDSLLMDVKQALEQNMEDTLSLIRGVGDVKVSLHIASSIETVFETEVTRDNSLTRETAADGTERTQESGGIQNAPAVITVDGDETALISQETGPEILGAVVVAEGVWDSTVKQEVFEAVRVMTNLPAHKIVVLDRKDG